MTAGLVVSVQQLGYEATQCAGRPRFGFETH